tara:strand:+ start:6742 stop:7875 length:1134 start_codon:yes stop_codon:yes gene_type:complete
MSNIVEKNENAIIIAPENRSLDILYFCDLLFNFKSIDFKFNEDKDYSDLIIIDQTMIKRIDDIQNPKNFNFLVFIWNGNVDLKKYESQFNESEKKHDIKLNYFVIGNFFKKKENFLNTDNFNFKKRQKRLIIKGLRSKLVFKYHYPAIVSIKRILSYPFKSFKKKFFPKIIFFGAGIIDKNEISIYAKSKKNLEISKNESFDDFKSYIWNEIEKKKNSGNEILELLKLFESIKFNETFDAFEIHERYFIIQNFFRHIFLSICTKFKNFEYIRRDGDLSMYHSPFFKNNYYVDFGSKVASNIVYSRFLFLKRFNKNILHINFYKNIDYYNTDYSKNIDNSIQFLKFINNQIQDKKCLSTIKLYELINEQFMKLDKINN